MDWEEIFVNYMADKGLISKIYRQHIQLNSRPNQKMGRRPKQTFRSEDTTMANKHMKKMLKTTVRYIDVLSMGLYRWRSLEATVKMRLKARSRRLKSKS